ncbi:hypothetical protein DVH05_003444 [Phytophthora capsici]|nr:hypothetical protein DVH05_003444 [Phytophthora capsici]
MSSLDHLLCPATSHRTPPRRLNYYEPDTSSPLPSDTDSKPNPRRCNVPECQKTAKRGGRCISHGGGNKCAVDGCTTSVVSRGLCVAHGGGKRCQTPACAKSAQSGGFCWVHGGGKKCGFRGCPKRAQSGGACIAHGGGKRCRIDGCSKVVQYDGLCVGHGGYRRCIFESCDRRAMANDYCQQHGGSSVCHLEHCYKRAGRGGMCSEHKAEASLQAVSRGLSTPSQSSDEDQDRSRTKRNDTNNYLASTSALRGTLSLETLASKASDELRASTLCTNRRSSCTTRIPDEIQPKDTRVVPGLSALLNEDDTFPFFAKKTDSRDRYVRHQHPRHQENQIYPVLPGIHVLQNYRSTPSNCGRSGATWSDSVATTKETGCQLKEDNNWVKQTPKDTQREQHHSDEHKIYVHSYYYKGNDGPMPCCTALPHQTLDRSWQ